MKLAAILGELTSPEFLTEATYKKFSVYRVGAGSKDLVGRNAGDLDGMGEFLVPRLKDSKNAIISRYEVQMMSRDFGKYSQFKASDYAGKKHTPNPEGQPIGREQSLYLTDAYWFSFPLNGAWDAKLKKTVKVSKVLDRFVQLGGKDLATREVRFSRLSPDYPIFLKAVEQLLR